MEFNEHLDLAQGCIGQVSHVSTVHPARNTTTAGTFGTTSDGGDDQLNPVPVGARLNQTNVLGYRQEGWAKHAHGLRPITEFCSTKCGGEPI